MDCGAINAMKRQNVKRDIDSSILDRFWDLVDISDEKRSRTAEQLLTALLLKQPSVNIGAWGRHSEGPPIANPNPTLAKISAVSRKLVQPKRTIKQNVLRGKMSISTSG